MNKIHDIQGCNR